PPPPGAPAGLIASSWSAIGAGATIDDKPSLPSCHAQCPPPPAEAGTLHWSPCRMGTGDAKLTCLRPPERRKWRRSRCRPDRPGRSATRGTQRCFVANEETG